jgi:class 3 adenylate cyclase
MGERPLEIVVALHVGTVVYGNIGAAERLDFTVNRARSKSASRLEAAECPAGSAGGPKSVCGEAA